MTVPDFIARLSTHTRAATEEALLPELASRVPEAIDLVLPTAAM